MRRTMTFAEFDVRENRIKLLIAGGHTFTRGEALQLIAELSDALVEQGRHPLLPKSQEQTTR